VPGEVGDAAVEVAFEVVVLLEDAEVGAVDRLQVLALGVEGRGPLRVGVGPKEDDEPYYVTEVYLSDVTPC
jgi:hypothetical protein